MKLFSFSTPPQLAIKLLATILFSLPLLSSSLQAEEQDSFEGFNRNMFYFNDKVDQYALRPLAVAYTEVMPNPLERGVANVFSNLNEVTNVVNDLLQGKFKQAGHDGGRFLINSTIGMAGLFDVAERAGLSKSDGEDFGQTLAVWGVGEGPYLMLPLVGPSTLRGAPSKLIDNLTNPLSHSDDVRLRNSARALDLLTTRVSLLAVDEIASGDRYLFVRDVYLQRNRFLVNDGVIEDDFGDFDEY
ncbi:VacJ family lipoprotein [Porticoccaceae bacterium]|nr:VacJ family lipoprotein [Porticoccaceae bacterium]